MLVVSGSVVPRAQSHSFVACEPSIVVGALVIAAESEVICELVEASRSSPLAFLERFGNTTVQYATPTRDDAFVQRFAHQRMRKCIALAILTLIFAQQLMLDELFENFDKIQLRYIEHRAQIVEFHRASNHRRDGKCFDRSLIDSICPGKNCLAHC